MTYPPLYPHLNRICSCHYLCLGFWQLQTNRQRPSWLTGQTLQLKPYCAFCLENPSHFSLLHSFLSLSDAVFPYLNITKNKWNIGHSHFFLHNLLFHCEKYNNIPSLKYMYWLTLWSWWEEPGQYSVGVVTEIWEAVDVFDQLTRDQWSLNERCNVPKYHGI